MILSESSLFPRCDLGATSCALLFLSLLSACEKEPKATGPTCPASEMVVERDNQGRLVSVVNFYGNGDSLAVRYRGDTAATVFRYAIRDSVALYERARYELNYPQGPHFSYHILPWTFNDTVEHRVRRYEMKKGRISAYTTLERYRQGNGSWQVDTFAQAHITYDSLGRMVSFSSHLPGSPLYGYGEHFIYGPQAPSYLFSFCPYCPVSRLESSRTRRERTIKPQFTGVNEDFEADRLARSEIGLYRQTLFSGLEPGTGYLARAKNAAHLFYRSL